LTAGTANYLLTANGAGNALTWTAPAAVVTGDSDQIVLGTQIFS